jgi:hypothetical protein
VVQIHPSPPLSKGGVAQLVEHLVCNQAVVGSIPVASTIDGRPLSTVNETMTSNVCSPSGCAQLFENKVNWFAAWQPRIEKEERG